MVKCFNSIIPFKTQIRKIYEKFVELCEDETKDINTRTKATSSSTKIKLFKFCALLWHDTIY